MRRAKPILTKQKIAALTKRAIKVMDQIEANKHLYEELDAILEALRDFNFKADERVAIIDNFAEKNTAFRTTAIRRFELKRLK